MAKTIEQMIAEMAAGLKPLYFTMDCNFILEQLFAAKRSLKEDDEQEGEYFGYYEELIQIFDILQLQDETKLREQLTAFVGNLSWDNFELSEAEQEENPDRNYYTLGSMFYMKLEWIIENTENESKQVAERLIENIPPLFDYLEDNLITK